MKKTLLLLLSLWTASQSQAQQYQWGYQVGSGFNDMVRAVAFDHDGNLYAAGNWASSLNDTLDLDPGTGQRRLIPRGGDDVFLIKFDRNGSILWHKGFGGNNDDYIQALAIDTANHVYIVGNCRGGNVDLSGGAGTTVVSTQNNSADVFLSKFDPNGVHQWGFLVGSDQGDGGSHVVVDKNNNVFITGSFGTGNVDFNPGAATLALTSSGGTDIFIAKYSSAGALLSATRRGGVGNDRGNALATDTAGNVYIVEEWSNTSNRYSTIFAKYTNNLSMTWQQFTNPAQTSNIDMYARGIQVYNDTLYLSGRFNSSVDFDPSMGSLSLNTAGLNDIFLAAYDLNGSIRWAKAIGNASDMGMGDMVIRNGEIHLVGSFIGTLDLDPSSETRNISTNTVYDGFYARYTIQGDFITGFRFGGNNDDRGQRVEVSNDGRFALCGSFEGSVNFNSLAGAADNRTGDAADGYAVVYDLCGEVSAQLSGTANLSCNSFLGASYQWYNCSTNQIIPNATGVSYTATATGDYAVIMTLGDCVDTSNCVSVSINPVSLNEQTAQGLSCFPNPVKDVLHFQGLSGEAQVEVFSLNGQLLERRWLNGQSFLSMSHYPSGLYVVMVLDAQGQVLQTKVYKD